jgi:hypothetical protein
MGGSTRSRERDDWPFVMMVHTVAPEDMDEWCKLIATQAGLLWSEVDWSFCAGRAVVRCARCRNAVVGAAYSNIETLRAAYVRGLQRLRIPDMGDHHFAMLLDAGGALVEQEAFSARTDAP